MARFLFFLPGDTEYHPFLGVACRRGVFLLHRMIVFSIPALFLAAGFSASPAQTRKGPLKPVIRQVDHILIQADDPRGLFDFFTGTLQLPVAWPIAEYSGFMSGGVGAGNVNLEVLRLAAAKSSSPGKRAQARFMGVALEPIRLADCVIELKARGIAFDPPVPYISRLPDGSEGILWTNVALSRLSRPGLSVFLCEYSPAFLHTAIRRNQLGGQLVLRKGGPLGIRSVKEIVIATTDPAGDKAAWQKLLLRATQPQAASWSAGNGPSIRLVAGTADQIVRIILQVDSLAAAKEWLAQKQMLGSVAAGQASIKRSSLQGLDIRVVQK